MKNPTASTLFVHTGMRQGELIIGLTDESDVVFLPPATEPFRFDIVQNNAQQQWAISRTFIRDGRIEALLTFDSEDKAKRALKELLEILLEPATPTQVAEQEHTPQPRRVIRADMRPIAIVLGGVLGLALLVFIGSKLFSSGNESTARQAPPAPQAQIQPQPAPSAPTHQPAAQPAPAPPAPPSSPGNAVLDAIQGR